LFINKISIELLRIKSAIFSQLLRKLQKVSFLIRGRTACEPDDVFHSGLPLVYDNYQLNLPTLFAQHFLPATIQEEKKSQEHLDKAVE
jgi:hypothetical protein